MLACELIAEFCKQLVAESMRISHKWLINIHNLFRLVNVIGIVRVKQHRENSALQIKHSTSKEQTFTMFYMHELPGFIPYQPLLTYCRFKRHIGYFVIYLYMYIQKKDGLNRGFVYL